MLKYITQRSRVCTFHKVYIMPSLFWIGEIQSMFAFKKGGLGVGLAWRRRGLPSSKSQINVEKDGESGAKKRWIKLKLQNKSAGISKSTAFSFTFYLFSPSLHLSECKQFLARRIYIYVCKWCIEWERTCQKSNQFPGSPWCSIGLEDDRLH